MEDAIKSILTTTVRDEQKRNEIGDLLDGKLLYLASSEYSISTNINLILPASYTEMWGEMYTMFSDRNKLGFQQWMGDGLVGYV